MKQLEQPVVDRQTRRNCNRFKSEQTASKYPSEYHDNNKRHQREKNAILRCLKKIPSNAHVLDFPCGTGRLIKILQAESFLISAADGSASMVKRASENTVNDALQSNDIQFYESDIFDSGFTKDQFDAVICNRLFHHFTESTDRIKALSELRRISKGPIVISFFNNFSTSMTFRRIRKYLRGQPFVDRAGVSMSKLKHEVDSLGLRITYETASCWGISPQWSIVIE